MYKPKVRRDEKRSLRPEVAHSGSSSRTGSSEGRHWQGGHPQWFLRDIETLEEKVKVLLQGVKKTKKATKKRIRYSIQDIWEDAWRTWGDLGEVEIPQLIRNLQQYS